jgi:beta-xylosidase
VLAQPAAPKPSVSKVWSADLGNGTYTNPVLYADYSDPDVTRVGEDFYLVSSSFDSVPGLPILHSRDLVNWQIIGHALVRQPPYDVYDKTDHGNGVWAPSLRYHAGTFYLFYPDPNYGIYVVTAKTITGPWSEPLLLKAAKGWIDPCPLWDDDGKAYLVNAVAASRSGIKSTLLITPMAPDASRLLGDSVMVVDGHQLDPTLEGPKLYKRGGYFYIFAPAGGVPTGWEVIFRAKNIYGPYERKVVLAQGKTTTNGPHQGAWVTTATGEDWFLHFQDQGPYGRVVHLEPMSWKDGWPVMGEHINDAGVGEPVLTHRKPTVAHPGPIATPADSDEFNAPTLGLQWQWQANPEPGWAFPSSALGVMRLPVIPATDRNLWNVPNVLMQKFPGPAFTVTTRLTFTAMHPGEETGLVIMGMNYAALAVVNDGKGLAIHRVDRTNAMNSGDEKVSAATPFSGGTLYLRAAVREGAMVTLSYSLDGTTFQTIGEPFKATAGRWVGAKLGIYATGPASTGERGYADFDWFRFEAP